MVRLRHDLRPTDVWTYWRGRSFCHGYRRHRQFIRPIVRADKLDAIVRTEDQKPTLL